jgi:hypothetical protein
MKKRLFVGKKALTGEEKRLNCINLKMRERTMRLFWAAPVVFAAVFFCAGCKTRVDYVGESYAPTACPDLYFSKEDIKRPYKVIGKAIVTPGDFDDGAADMQSALVGDARTRGADAVLVERFEKEKTGSHTAWTNNSWDHKVDKNNTLKTGGGYANTTDDTDLAMTASYIKYTDGRGGK